MSKNASLRRAKEEKNDEFYTLLPDIENELRHYKKHFKEKIVLCNCDDPYESNFFKYFALNFNHLGLKKLICTCYAGSPIVTEQLSLFDVKGLTIKEGYEKHPYKIEITEVIDSNNDGAINISDVEYLIKNKANTLTLLKGDGDFRSEECIELLKEADIVVTNPPFSLFREYIDVLITNEKQFLVIGNVTAVNNQAIFNLIKNNNLWKGFTSGSQRFLVPTSNSRNNTYIGDDGRKYAKFGNICWYTNLDHSKRHEELILYKKYNNEEFSRYFNLDGIDVPKIADIPCDYYGFIGVPVSFMDVYNPKQFQIIDTGTSIKKKYIHTVTDNKKTIEYIDPITQESVYKFDYTVSERKIGNSLRLDKEGVPGDVPFSRIIIQRIDGDDKDGN